MKRALIIVLLFVAACGSKFDNKWGYEYSNKLMDTVVTLDQQLPTTVNKDLLFSMRGAKLKTVASIVSKMDDADMKAKVMSRYNQLNIEKQ